MVATNDSFSTVDDNDDVDVGNFTVVGLDVPIVDTSTYVAFNFEIVVPYELFFISLNSVKVV